MRLRRWFRCEFWVWILFLIRNTEFMCCTIQICAQHGSHNENIPRKVAPKFNWALSGGSFSRLTFWVRRRTCLVNTSRAGSCSIFPPLTWAPCPKRWDFLCIQVSGWSYFQKGLEPWPKTNLKSPGLGYARPGQIGLKANWTLPLCCW